MVMTIWALLVPSIVYWLTLFYLDLRTFMLFFIYSPNNNNNNNNNNNSRAAYEREHTDTGITR